MWTFDPDFARTRLARRKRRHPGRPVAVAVERAWVDHPDDGTRARVVLFDGHQHVAPEGSVLVFRATERMGVLALEDVLERRAAGYPRATAMRELAADVEGGLVDESLWLNGDAA
jgi:hypothetical protein